MLFNSIDYLLFFLPVTLVVFQMFSRTGTTEAQMSWLVLASLFFYGSWNPKYLLLIICSIVVNFAIGRVLARDTRARGAWLASGVVFNLGLLAYFKYTGFFANGLNSLGLWLIPVPEITLPLAISFFTFQQIAYLVDVSRGECKEYQFSHYALFVAFFPQLIAGPIVHHKEVMPQFRQLRAPAKIPTDFAVGLTFIAMGLFKKVIMADSLALIAAPVFNTAAFGGNPNTVDALLAIFAFSFQIYFDFSGYSDIAIGSARLFGIRLPENFRSPYKSQSIIEIWQRWHMTLSRFLRDYLYFPLGGNRHGVARRYRNLMITMVLGGLWHGAGWTFVIWGGLHGIYLWANHAWRRVVKRTGLHILLGRTIFKPLFILITFSAWSIALAVFNAADIATAWLIISSGFVDFSQGPSPLLNSVFADNILWQLVPVPAQKVFPYTPIFILMLVAAMICWLLPNSQEFLIHYEPVVIADNAPLEPRTLSWQPSLKYALLTALLLGISLLSLSSISRFIYFQF